MLGVMDIRKIKWVIPVLLMPVLIFNISFALWKHDAEIRFRVTISQPAHGSYDTILEGIQYNIAIYERIRPDILSFNQQLTERIAEINDLPYGGITFEELSQERNHYRSVVIPEFRERIQGFAQAINELTVFYKNSSQEEKNEVPDFWDYHQILWDYRVMLDNLCLELDDLVTEFWYAGEEKIDYG